MISFVSANLEDEFGTIRVFQSNDIPVQRATVSNGKLFASDWMTVFRYNTHNASLGISPLKFLNLNAGGKLIISAKEQSGYKVGNSAGGKGVLSLAGDKLFYVCEDQSIEFWGTCEGANRISLIFDAFPLIR